VSETTLSVEAGIDDGYEMSDGNVLLASTSANCNASQPYIAYIIRSNLYLISSTNDTPNLTIRAEGRPAALATTTNNLSSRTKTIEGVVWNENLASAGNEYRSTPDFAAVVQEVVDDPLWEEGDDIAIFLIDNGAGGLLRVSMRDSGTAQEPELYLAWEAAAVSGGLTYAWPSDYWPDEYWAEYWPDYGTETPPTSSIIPLVMHHLKQQGIS
jgi:hypothetical protein